MNKCIIGRQLCFIVLTFLISISNGQIFEGSITYKMEAFNPNTELIPDSTWQNIIKEQFGSIENFAQAFFA